MRCWFAETFWDAGPCDGQLVRAHLIKEQTLRREAPDADPKDPRVWVPACGGPMGNAGHQAMYKPDGFRPVPRDVLPLELEEFAAEYGLGWYLARIYGPACKKCDDTGVIRFLRQPPDPQTEDDYPCDCEEAA
jgi:hypothetical protein